MKNQNSASHVKGIKIRSLSLLLMGIGCILFFLTSYETFKVREKYTSLIHNTDNYIESEENIDCLLQTSNYLTEQVRQYVITTDFKYMEAYFQEIDVEKSRERAVENMKKSSGANTEACERLSEALNKSNALTDLEIHSMKLISLLNNNKEKQLPDKVKEYKLSQKELEYTPQEIKDAAYSLVFGESYTSQKEAIFAEIKQATTEISQYTGQQQDVSAQQLKHTISLQKVYIIGLFLLIIVTFVMIIVLILKPINIYIKCINDESILTLSGAYEFKYLALTYNNVFKINEARSKSLQHRAEHDALTGLMNRHAFEQLTSTLWETDDELALILLDIDVFKSINDSFGHEMGDKALTNLADLLRKNFRGNDYAIRIGGDEFAVIMNNITIKDKDIIARKFTSINEELQNPANGLPKYSISVGIAFSTSGYNDELYRHADEALYRTKELGRCGYTFYDELAQ